MMDVTKKMDEFANEAEALMKNILISVLLFLLTQELDSRSIYICNKMLPFNTRTGLVVDGPCTLVTVYYFRLALISQWKINILVQ